MSENATTTMTSIYFIAPHLFTKKRSPKKLPPRHRLPLSPLNESVMSTSGNDSDPQLDAQSLQYTRDDLRGRLGKDSHGETVIRRVSGRTDASDTSSSVCTCPCFESKAMTDSSFHTVSGALSVARGSEDLTQLLKDAEDRADQRLRAAEERAEDRADKLLKAAEERRVSDLRVAEDRVDKLLKAAEEHRVSDLKVAEERRVSDLKMAEERRVSDLKMAEERRISDLKVAEERRISDLKVAEEHVREAGERADRYLTSYLGIIYLSFISITAPPQAIFSDKMTSTRQ
jgi:hypothetical protein